MELNDLVNRSKTFEEQFNRTLSLEQRFKLADLTIDLINRYSYSWELSSDICELLEEIIIFYGERYADQIIETIKTCKVEILPNKNDVSVLKYKNGKYISTPIIKDGVLIRTDKKIILPPSYNHENPAYRGILLNQLLKAARSSQNEYHFGDKTIEQRQGFKKTTYKINEDDSLTEIGKLGEGYEICSLANAEHIIMSKKYSKYEPTNAHEKELNTSVFFEDEEMLGIKNINDAVMTGNYDVLTNNFQEHAGISFDEFLERVDRLHELWKKCQASIDDKIRKSAEDEFNKHFDTQIVPVGQTIFISLHPEIFKQKEKPKTL